VKKGKAHLPCKNVHELMEVEGKTGWLQNPLRHIDSPTFKRYLERNSRYVDYLARELAYSIQHATRNTPNKKNLNVTCYMLYVTIDWLIFKPISWFFHDNVPAQGNFGWLAGSCFFLFFSFAVSKGYYWRFMHRS
jgi:hypothetical protein